MKRVVFILLLFVLVGVLIGVLINHKPPQGPFAGKVFREFHFTGARAELFEKALRETMEDSGATFSRDTGIEVRGEVQWKSNGTLMDYLGNRPWFKMVVSTDTSCNVIVACSGTNYDFPAKYPYELAVESVGPIADAIHERLRPTIIPTFVR